MPVCPNVGTFEPANQAESHVAGLQHLAEDASNLLDRQLFTTNELLFVVLVGRCLYRDFCKLGWKQDRSLQPAECGVTWRWADGLGKIDASSRSNSQPIRRHPGDFDLELGIGRQLRPTRRKRTEPRNSGTSSSAADAEFSFVPTLGHSPSFGGGSAGKSRSCNDSASTPFHSLPTNRPTSQPFGHNNARPKPSQLTTSHTLACKFQRQQTVCPKLGHSELAKQADHTSPGSSISARMPRISSIAIFSRRMNSFSSSWSAVAFTLMSANLAGKRIDVSSQDNAE